MGIKLPEVRPRRAVLFEEIAMAALAYSKEHKASYPGDRSTIGKLLPVFAKTPINEITPQTIKAYLDTREDLTKTTINRYRGTLSMIFQEAIRNGKADSNPARLVRLHREDNSRVRFVTYAEETMIERSSASDARSTNPNLRWLLRLECVAVNSTLWSGTVWI